MQLKQLGPYEIDRPLGRGGMGSVYAATDRQTGQRVALKALSPHLAIAEGFRERFEAEIESLKTLRHDGIVRLYGYGEQDGVLFYSMELVDGVSLEDELRAGRRFNWREVTGIAIQLSLALKHAHDHGIVHRDIKPANILLYNDDQVKLADFGIARLFGTTQLTTAGGVLGTADYMSPEQAEGRPVTPRCDQYSLGGVMYALLAGRPPFRATNLPQMLQLQRFAEPESLRRYAPDTPEQLERVIMRLLAKDPGDRFPNTQVLARHLQAMARALSRPAANDFALAGDQPVARDTDPGHDRHDPDLEHSLASVPTQAEAHEPPRTDSRAVGDGKSLPVIATQDAATLAAEVAGSGEQGGGAPCPGSPLPAPRSPLRFTTLEEEETRLRAQQQRSWPLVAVQLAGLVAVLAAVAAAGYHLLRPPSADELYRTITARVESVDDASLGNVANVVDDFLRRYPDDPRASELQQYQQQIELDRLERRLHRQARSGGSADPSLLPVEQLYLSAVRAAEDSPDSAAAMLQSLVDLYGPMPDEPSDAQVSAIVRLAEKRLDALQADLARQRERQLAALGERLDVADRLATSDPQQAAAIYRAIIALHGDDAWAQQLVDEARSRLAEVEER